MVPIGVIWDIILHMVRVIEIMADKYLFRCGVCGWESTLMPKQVAFTAPRPEHECKKQGEGNKQRNRDSSGIVSQ